VTEHFEVAVLGAGFGGLAVAHRLAKDGIHDLVIFERDDGVGGTWRANTYPGAACDVPSHLYSLSFAPNPYWSSAYAAQPEILAYIEDCYDCFDVRRKVRTNTAIVSARWDPDASSWTLRDVDGNDYRADVLVSAIGMFNTPKLPNIAGLADFGGAVFHSGRWDADHDVTGERVAVIGTGASAIQIVPAIAERTAQLDVYQRSAPWVLPRRNEQYSSDQQDRFAAHHDEALEHRRLLHDMFEQTTAFLADDPMAVTLATMALEYLDRKVPDAELRAELTSNQPFGCTRTLVSSDWYPTLQRDDVELITTGIEAITATGIRCVDGSERPVDTIVLCTGFHASDYLRGIEVTGRDGVNLHDRWDGVPSAYHGMAVPGFPNFFMLYGPNTNQGGNSILLMLESQAQFVASALQATREAGAAWVDVTPRAMADYETALRSDLAGTVWAGGCRTYFHSDDGHIVTQLPHTAGWYAHATHTMDRADFNLGGGSCTTS